MKTNKKVQFFIQLILIITLLITVTSCMPLHHASSRGAGDYDYSDHSGHGYSHGCH